MTLQRYDARIVQPYTAPIMSNTIFPLLTLRDKFQNFLTVKIGNIYSFHCDFKLQSHSLLFMDLNWWLQHSILEQTFYLFRRYPRNGDIFVTYLVTILQVVTWAKYSPQLSLCLVNNKRWGNTRRQMFCVTSCGVEHRTSWSDAGGFPLYTILFLYSAFPSLATATEWSAAETASSRDRMRNVRQNFKETRCICYEH